MRRLALHSTRGGRGPSVPWLSGDCRIVVSGGPVTCNLLGPMEPGLHEPPLLEGVQLQFEAAGLATVYIEDGDGGVV